MYKKSKKFKKKKKKKKKSISDQISTVRQPKRKVVKCVEE
jgi:hypothetical protein